MRKYTAKQFKTKLNKIYCCDCLKGMAAIPDRSIDMILCDLPYGTTACKWDAIIPQKKLGRKFIGFETEQKYVDITNKRLAEIKE